MATITFDEIANRYNTVPLAVFDNMEESEAFYVKWIPIMGDRMSGGKLKNIRVVFSDRAVYKNVAHAGRNTVTIQRCFLRTNLDYRPELPREIIVHEVGHLLTPGVHGHQWKAMVSGWGIKPTRTLKLRDSDFFKTNSHYYMRCPTCGVEWRRYRMPRYVKAYYTCGKCGYRELKWEKVEV